MRHSNFGPSLFNVILGTVDFTQKLVSHIISETCQATRVINTIFSISNQNRSKTVFLKKFTFCWATLQTFQKSVTDHICRLQNLGNSGKKILMLYEQYFLNEERLIISLLLLTTVHQGGPIFEKVVLEANTFYLNCL